MKKINHPLSFVRSLTGGGLGELNVYRDASGGHIVGKFPKDHSAENQRLIDDEHRRLERSQGEYVVQLLGPLELTDGRRGFAMELMDGSLGDKMKFGALGCLEAIDLMWGAMYGVMLLHESANGAFHGDLKPPNILHRGRRTKLADFGLARGGLGQTRMLNTQWGGTDGYRPPEGFASSQGDVYSMGATLWALLLGRHPTKNEALRISVPGQPKLESLINDMLAVNPYERPSMREAVGRLAQARIDASRAQSSSFWNGLAGVLGIVLMGVVASAVLKGK